VHSDLCNRFKRSSSDFIDWYVCRYGYFLHHCTSTRRQVCSRSDDDLWAKQRIFILSWDWSSGLHDLRLPVEYSINGSCIFAWWVICLNFVGLPTFSDRRQHAPRKIFHHQKNVQQRNDQPISV
jgi:hypothetical protein